MVVRPPTGGRTDEKWPLPPSKCPRRRRASHVGAVLPYAVPLEAAPWRKQLEETLPKTLYIYVSFNLLFIQICFPLSRFISVFVLPCVASLVLSRNFPSLLVCSLAIFFSVAPCCVFRVSCHVSLFCLFMLMCTLLPHDVTSEYSRHDQRPTHHHNFTLPTVTITLEVYHARMGLQDRRVWIVI